MPAAERYSLLSSIEHWVISSLVEFLHRQYESGAPGKPERARADAQRQPPHQYAQGHPLENVAR